MRNFAYKKFANSIIRLAIMVSSITCVVIAFTYAKYFDSLTNDYANNEGLPGDIGLRSYFHTGTGTKQDPYVITRPIHYYNLTRLQNLGIFDLNTSHAGDSTNSSDHRYYFQVGYDLDNADKDSNVTTGLDVYASDASDAAVATYLDMSGTTYASNVLSVGNEGMPFYGVYNGSNILIKGLTIHSTPEDVGVFGYVASSGKVENALNTGNTSTIIYVSESYDTFLSLHVNNATSSKNWPSTWANEKQSDGKNGTGNVAYYTTTQPTTTDRKYWHYVSGTPTVWTVA